MRVRVLLGLPLTLPGVSAQDVEPARWQTRPLAVWSGLTPVDRVRIWHDE